jgi:hypothetical protein
MKKALARSILGTLFILFLVGRPVDAIVSGVLGLRNDPSSSASIAETLNKPALIKLKDNKRVNIIFLTAKRNAPVGPESVFLQGRVVYRRREYPVAAAIIDGKMRVTFPSVPRGSKLSRQRINTLTISKNGTGRLASVPVSVAHARTCANHAEHSESPPTVMALNEGMPSNLSHVVTLHTYADQEWIAKYGARSNEEIISIINTAEAIYTRQLGIRFRIVGQNSYYTLETDPSKMLRQIQSDASTQNDNTDLKHLFTGKDMDSTTVGLAYVGTVCAYPNWAYGITQQYYTLTPFIFAHEIGHNFNANHTYTGLMAPYISAQSSSGFSDFSLNQINNHLNYFGSCLSLEATMPNLATSRITISYSNKIITGKLVDISGKPLPNQKIIITLNRRKQTVRTNAQGQFRTRVVVRGKYTAKASTAGGEKTSRSISFTVR